MTKKILILGGGQAQLGLIKTAKKLGLFVIVAGIKGNYPGYYYADKCYFEDILNKEAILEIAKKEKIDGVTMVCSDIGLSTIGFVCDNLGLPGISEKAAEISSNKMKMKNLLCESNINTAKYKIVANDDKIQNIITELRFPLITKAVDLQGSKGIYISRNPVQLIENYKKSISESKFDYCLVEEFIEGEEFGAQAFVSQGKVIFVQPHGDIVLRKGNLCIPIGHFMPLVFNKALNEKICNLAEKAIAAVGINNSAVNIDFIIKDNIPYIIELTGRAGANSLPEITSEFLGINYYEIIIKNALGENISCFLKNNNITPRFILSRQLFSSTNGSLEKIEFKGDNHLLKFEPFVKYGDSVHEFRNSRDCIGRVIFTGKTLNECQEAMNQFMNTLQIKVF